jgi:AcrR family transcriptional regulator
MSGETASVGGGERLSAAARREALLDVALRILLEHGEPAISIGAVAERAEVTRALVYKHFDNRDDLIIELQRREAERLDRELVEVVASTTGGFEPKLRALARSMIEVTDRWDTIFAPLRYTVAGPVGRREQRNRDRRTVKYFAGLAVADLGVPDAVARRAMSMMLGGIDPLMAMVRPSMTATDRRQLADLYVDLVVGGLVSISD